MSETAKTPVERPDLKSNYGKLAIPAVVAAALLAKRRAAPKAPAGRSDLRPFDERDR